jgi:crotonobetainyl-CoA:carnitine CoA-transferase CaiB-like acyl-CoA transferase
VTGSADAAAKVGISIADIASGLYAFTSILAALRLRDRTGAGDRIDISMLECLAEWMTPALYVWMGAGRVVARAGIRHNMIVPYGAYACADGSVMLAVQTDREWRRLCAQVLGDAALADDPRFVTNAGRVEPRDELEALIEARFAAVGRADLLAALERADIPTASVNDVPAVVEHPQLAARRRWTTAGTARGEIPALVPPFNISNVEPLMGRVPELGEHTDEVLRLLENP